MAQILGGMTFLTSFIFHIPKHKCLSSLINKPICVWKSYLLCTDSVRGFDHSVYTRIDDGYDAPFYVRYLPHHGLNLIDPILFHTLHLLKKEKTFCYFVYILFLHPFWQLNLITVTTWFNACDVTEWNFHIMKFYWSAIHMIISFLTFTYLEHCRHLVGGGLS